MSNKHHSLNKILAGSLLAHEGANCTLVCIITFMDSGYNIFSKLISHTLLWMIKPRVNHCYCKWSYKNVICVCLSLFFLPFPELKKQSISTLEREWDTQSAELGTSPSCGGLRSVVRTRHQPGRSLGRSSSSTVWPRWKSNQLLKQSYPMIYKRLFLFTTFNVTFSQRFSFKSI